MSRPGSLEAQFLAVGTVAGSAADRSAVVVATAEPGCWVVTVTAPQVALTFDPAAGAAPKFGCRWPSPQPDIRTAVFTPKRPKIGRTVGNQVPYR
jgi:hypothetical protein